jgi:hypothetical protein
MGAEGLRRLAPVVHGFSQHRASRDNGFRGSDESRLTYSSE